MFVGVGNKAEALLRAHAKEARIYSKACFWQACLFGDRTSWVLYEKDLVKGNSFPVG